MESQLKPLMSRSEVAKTLGVCARTVDALVKMGRLQKISVGRQVKFAQEDVQRFIDQCRAKAA